MANRTNTNNTTKNSKSTKSNSTAAGTTKKNTTKSNTTKSSSTGGSTRASQRKKMPEEIQLDQPKRRPGRPKKVVEEVVEEPVKRGRKSKKQEAYDEMSDYQEYDNYDEYPEKENLLDEKMKVSIALVVTLAISAILFISNLSFGGKVGNAIVDFLFGTFGIIQYVLPIVLFFAVAFLISNKFSGISIAKTVLGFIFVISVSTLTELFKSGSNGLGYELAFSEGRNNHKGGGFFGSVISDFLCDKFGLSAAYLIILVVMFICACIVFNLSIMDMSNWLSVATKQISSNLRTAKRQRVREQKIKSSQDAVDNREARKKRVSEKFEQQKLQAEQTDGKRVERKFSGVTNNTLLEDNTGSPEAIRKDGLTEIKFNFDDQKDVVIADSNRTKVSSDSATETVVRLEESIPVASNYDDTSYQDNTYTEVRPVEHSVSVSASPAFIINEPVENEPAYEPAYEETEYNEPVADSFAQEQVPDPFTEQAVNPVEMLVAPEPVKTEPKPIEPVRPEPVATEPLTQPNKVVAEAPKAKDELAYKAPTVKQPKDKPYKFPPLNLLKDGVKGEGDSKEYLTNQGEKLIRTLKNFGVDARILEVTRGPSVTRFEIAVAEGTKVSKVVGLSDDLKMNMAVTDLRIEAPIPGKSAIGIEIPNKNKVGVSLAELIKSKKFREDKSKIAFCVGKDITGDIVVGNIAKFPHVLIAGSTGSGKSVCINSIIMSILYHATPKEVKLIMVDPKQVELKVYNGIPHLLMPVVTDPKKAAAVLQWACAEMDRRYKLLSKYGVRNLEGYNEKIDENGIIHYTDDEGDEQEEAAEHLPQIVILLDELADLMMVAGNEVETSICRIAQLARAAGMHLVIATQRPTANVLTGLIKGNVPSRIAFAVASALDSRVILDENGAESLLGHGDMLYQPYGSNKPVRLQGAFVSDDEILDVVEFIKNNNERTEEDKEKQKALQQEIVSVETSSNAGKTDSAADSGADNGLDPLFADAARLLIESQKGSIGYIQRNFRVGFNRAARIMDQLCENKVVGPELGTKPREILMNAQQLEELLNNINNEQ